jgi:hypothetical protein
MRILALIIVAVMMAACTSGNNSGLYLPSRDSITAGETITVQGNKNLYAIAREHNVSMRDIIVLNDIKAPYSVRDGQSLILPATHGAPQSFSGGVTSAPASDVERADLAPIAPSSVQSSSLPPPQFGKAVEAKKTVVDSLNAPSVAPKSVSTTVKGGKMDAEELPPAQASVSQSSASAQVKSTLAQVERPVPAAPKFEPPTQSAPNMVWPVQGPVLSTFGPKGEGLNNDGVNIGAPKGSPVVAAANGIVVYAGNEMKGFGNLVLIRHQGGWVTAYAHLDRTLIAKDAVVAQGDMIGTVGKTGNVGSPQLHFETRYKDKAVDPKSIVKDQ